MYSLELLEVAKQRGLRTEENCSTLLWTKMQSDKSKEEFFQALRTNSNFAPMEMYWLVKNFADQLPEDVVFQFIEKICQDPEQARSLARVATSWPESKQRKFYECFIKVFAEDPHTKLAELMFIAGDDEPKA